MPGGAAARWAMVALSALLACALAIAPAAGGKPKKKGGANKTRVFSSGPIAAAIPDDPGVNASGILQTRIAVGKAMKGRRIDDVNVSLRVTHADVVQLSAELTAPNGATTELVRFSAGTSWGAGPADCAGTPLTLDDETPTEISEQAAPQPGQLALPYAGVAQPAGLFVPLAVMDGGPARGAWTLTVRDGVPGGVGTVHCWSVQVKPRPKRGRG
ncbi:MAG: hypothetical protein ACXWFN_13140 [Solirubrobacterales bacterium]